MAAADAIAGTEWPIDARLELGADPPRSIIIVSDARRAPKTQSRIGFLYPHDPQHDVVTNFVGRGIRPDTPLPETAIDKLDFNYRMSGDRGLQPVRVFNDGTHTYLQMPQGMSDIPVLFAVGPTAAIRS